MTEELIEPQTGSFTNKRNHKLTTVLFEPPKDVPLVGVWARLHGLGDHSKRYEAGNRWFAKQGYAVWMFDNHGHGLSEPHGEEGRFMVTDFSHLADETEQFLQEVVRPWHQQHCSGVPLFYGGASMGALVMMHVVADGRVESPDGLVLSASAAGIVRTPLMRLQEPVAGLLNYFMPAAKLVPALEPERLLSCKDLIQSAKDDKYLNHDNVRVCTGVSMLKGTLTLPAKLPNISCPVIMLHGGCDVTCPSTMAKQALEGMSSRDKTWVLMSDAKHDLELDLWRDDWFAYVLEWMKRQVAKFEKERAAPVVVGKKRQSTSFLNEIRV